MRILIIFLAFLLNSSIALAQATGKGKTGKEENNLISGFHFIYIENSRVEKGDGLTGSAYDIIEKKLDSLSQLSNTHTILFASNVLDAKIVTDKRMLKKSGEEIINGEKTSYPDDKEAERELILSSIMKDSLSISQSFTFDFFVTEYFAKSLRNSDAAILTTGLAAEIGFLYSKKQTPIRFNFYYTSKSGELKPDELIRILNFSNKGQALSVNIIPLS